MARRFTIHTRHNGNAVNKHGCTALWLAIAGNKIETVIALLGAPDVDVVRYQYDKTILHSRNADLRLFGGADTQTAKVSDPGAQQKPFKSP